MTDDVVAKRYRLIRRIGIGGMGHVWLARDEVLRRNVAVKEVYLPDGLSDDEVNEMHLRTLREARAAARLSHPSVIRIYDVLQAGDRPWIVMEYVPSRSLAQVVLEDGPLPVHRVAAIGLALLGALVAAHEAGVLHRDVKPGNVLLADDGRIMLTDFGLAVFDDLGMQVTRAGVVHGSPQFIAPERAKDGTSTAASDFWSLGATLYAAVEGRSPYARPSSYATLAALATEPPDVPERAGDLKPLLAGLLRRNPRSRINPDDAETLLRKMVGPGLIPRQLGNEDSDEVRVDKPTTPSSSAPPTTPNGLPIRNRRTNDDGRRDRPAGVPVSPAPVRPQPEIDTDRRMAQAWALATPGPLPVVRGARKPAGRRRHLALGAGILLVAVLVAAGAYALLTGDKSGSTDDNGAVLPPGPSANGNHPPAATVAQWPCTPPAPGSTRPVPSSTPLFKGANGLLEGWVWYTDADQRYQIPAQARMQLLTGPGIACFYDSATTRVAGVLQSQGRAGQTPVDLLRDQIDPLSRGPLAMPEFTMVRPPAPVEGVPKSAEAEFTYIGPQSLKMHAAMRNFVEPSGDAYTVMWQATDLDWAIGESDNYTFFWLNFTRLPETSQAP